MGPEIEPLHAKTTAEVVTKIVDIVVYVSLSNIIVIKFVVVVVVVLVVVVVVVVIVV